MTLTEYYDKLDGFDWYYDFSDDHRVYTAGEVRKANLIGMSTKGGDEFKELYSAFKRHHFSGPAWSTDKEPKPERPE
jgi:hypothetical protein